MAVDQRKRCKMLLRREVKQRFQLMRDPGNEVMKKLHGDILICDVLFVTAAISTSVIDVFLAIEMADAGTHRIKTANLCQFCGETASSKKTSARPKQKLKLQFERHGIDIEEDNNFIHPPNVCLTCVGYFYRLRRSIGNCIEK